MQTQTSHDSIGCDMLSISIRDADVLYSAYMPFIENGGLFIPTGKACSVGDAVFILLSLMDEPRRIPLSGTVVWVTPHNAENNRAQGIGVQFRDKDNAARPLIEKYLAGMQGGHRQTHTL